ncbi:hypothetical protein B296_00043458 [Ensete ventricosum]|uniref:Uncharacterized protein n=1 Tax=Ensete ventricosum TaxID=4639 RepID=A0A426XWH6_ENSVE|nr:hypothetical protein B296_00043458 [Ensete ventricosum]
MEQNGRGMVFKKGEPNSRRGAKTDIEALLGKTEKASDAVEGIRYVAMRCEARRGREGCEQSRRIATKPTKEEK